MDTPLIDPKTLPTWTVAAFALALLALCLAFVGVYRANNLAVITQAEVLALHKRIGQAAPAAPAQAPAAQPATK